MMLELGGGTLPHPRADVVIDLHHPRNAPAQDATVTPWQAYGEDRWLADGAVDEVYASHFMEHIPKGQPIIDVMNEAWRVLRPGGTFTIVLPLVGWTSPHDGTGHLVNGWQPYADPTHVQPWWLPESLLYFCEGPFKPNADYGIRTWARLGDWIEPERVPNDWLLRGGGESFWTVREGWEGVARLVKP